VIAITVAPIIQSLVENQMQFMLNVVGLKMRNGLMAAIYRKCLRLSNAALQSESTGRVVTLMSNDAQKVCERAGSLWLQLVYGAGCCWWVQQLGVCWWLLGCRWGNSS
jgi:ATP-binding cassette subfamily C (CFTR/MRP) protein 1